MNNRYWIAISIVAFMAGGTHLLSYGAPTQNKAAVARSLPMIIGQWFGRELPVYERVFSILETDDVISREYEESSGLEVELCVVCGSDNRKSVHPPEICYEGAGWTVASKEAATIPLSGTNGESLDVVRLDMTKGTVRQFAFYWYICGTEYTADYYSQQLKMAWSRLLRKNGVVGLVRVSVYLTDRDAASATASKFISALLPVLRSRTPSAGDRGRKRTPSFEERT